ncbi:InlB B-repeat-containing protein [Aquirufa ecclesiirivi]|uniref:InlB B-repeat-containing protein n=1 Tax=Aquirufa ecclesiirivi TaxID=2715124 RepID=UPI003BB04E49
MCQKHVISFLLALFLFSCSKETIEHRLSVVAVPSAGGSVSPSTGSFEQGTIISLLANPAPEYLFKDWSGSISGTSNPYSLNMNADKNITAHFEKRTYPLSIEIEGQGTVQETVISTLTSTPYSSGTVVQLKATPVEGWVFKGWTGDLSSESNPSSIRVDKAVQVKATFVTDYPVKLDLMHKPTSLFVSQNYPIKLEVTYKSGTKKVIEQGFTSSIIDNGNLLAKLTNQNLLAIKSGQIQLKIDFENLSQTYPITISPVEDVADFDVFLKTPMSSSSIVVPVVVISFLPTQDGINLDMNMAPDDYWELKNSTLQEAKNRFTGELKITKFGIEEGSRFRQFTTSQEVKPYAGFQVIKFFNVYEVEFTNYITGLKTFDYHKLFQKLGMDTLVNQYQVKEIWFNAFVKDKFPSVVNSPYNDPNTYYNFPESNMSSRITGDVSNSYYFPNDLPIYNHTYVVYGNSGHRGADTNLHNRGHQIEAQMNYIENLVHKPAIGNALFKNHFVGIKPSTGLPLNRVGMTHFPPNTSVDYDYDNSNLVSSDIVDWQASGGTTTKVNRDLWKNIVYPYSFVNKNYGRNQTTDYSQDAQVKWLIFWWQSIPGLNHPLTYNNQKITNWWDIFYHWDDAIKNGKGLYEIPVGKSKNTHPSLLNRVQTSAAEICTENEIPLKKTNSFRIK